MGCSSLRTPTGEVVFESAAFLAGEGVNAVAGNFLEDVFHSRFGGKGGEWVPRGIFPREAEGEAVTPEADESQAQKTSAQVGEVGDVGFQT